MLIFQYNIPAPTYFSIFKILSSKVNELIGETLTVIKAA
jgi:hypothetical protein